MRYSSLFEKLVSLRDDARLVAVKSLGRLEIKDEVLLRRVLVALNRCLYDRAGAVREEVLIAMRQLLEDRRLPS